MYTPIDHYLWDFWIGPRRSANEPYHLFHLQAPRSIAHPEDRHWIASVGHATSHDLVHWEPQPTALAPSNTTSWDDKAIWTGSVFDYEGLWHFYYTALSHSDDGHVQRVGLATSPDLFTWTQHPGNPVLEADSRFLRKRGPAPWEWESFRDPWVIRVPDNDRYLMYLTASANGQEPDSAGVVALAESTDLISWSSLPPVTIPGDFGELEVPQVERIGDRWYLFFCTGKHSAARLARTGPSGNWIGTHYLVADTPTGPFHAISDQPLVADAKGTWYAGRIVRAPDESLAFMAWKRQDETTGEFIGGLSNPARLIQHPDGTLSVDASQLWV